MRIERRNRAGVELHGILLSLRGMETVLLEAASGAPMDDESFRQILQYFDLSWDGYRRVRKGVKKRIARHMRECGCRGITEYVLLLQQNMEARKKAREFLTVSISSFFRDLRLWEVLEERLIPALVGKSERTGKQPVRAWSAGCSCGEEVYSLKILWAQLEKRFPAPPPLEVWATDSNPEVLERARIAVYPQSSLKNLAPAIVNDIFIPASSGFAIRDELKHGIHWLHHDFTTEPPPKATFDLLLLRNNLLTYYEPPIKIPAFLQILEALRPGGFLIIGNNEELPNEESPLRGCSEYRCIFEKISDPKISRLRSAPPPPAKGRCPLWSSHDQDTPFEISCLRRVSGIPFSQPPAGSNAGRPGIYTSPYFAESGFAIALK